MGRTKLCRTPKDSLGGKGGLRQGPRKPLEGLFMIDYDIYIKSPEWRTRCNEAKQRAGHKCQLCSSSSSLHVHHNTYERLGNESPTDLTVLCELCHNVFHAKRDERTARKYAHAEWMKRAKKATPKVPTPPPVTPEPISMEPTPGAKMIEVEITPEYVASLKGLGISITSRGLMLLGEPMGCAIAGWQTRNLGKKIIVSEAALLSEQKLAAEKRAGQFKKKPIPNLERTNPTPEQIAAVRKDYANFPHHGFRWLAQRYNLSKNTIRNIVGKPMRSKAS